MTQQIEGHVSSVQLNRFHEALRATPTPRVALTRAVGGAEVPLPSGDAQLQTIIAWCAEHLEGFKALDTTGQFERATKFRDSLKTAGVELSRAPLTAKVIALSAHEGRNQLEETMRFLAAGNQAMRRASFDEIFEAAAEQLREWRAQPTRFVLV